MAIIRESSMELEKEKKALQDRMQEQQRVIEVYSRVFSVQDELRIG